MKKIKYIWIIFFIVLLFASSFYAIKVKSSFVHDVDISKNLKKIDSYNVQVHVYGTPETAFFKNDIKSFDELEKLSDVIVKVRLKTDYRREKYYFSILTAVEILKTYKGDFKENQTINLFEPVDLNQSAYFTEDGYTIIQAQTEYILFLNQFKNIGYTLGTKQKYMYTPVSSIYSKYICDSKMKLKTLDNVKLNSGKIEYGSVKYMDIITSQEPILNRYLEFKAKVFNKFK